MQAPANPADFTLQWFRLQDLLECFVAPAQASPSFLLQGKQNLRQGCSCLSRSHPRTVATSVSIYGQDSCGAQRLLRTLELFTKTNVYCTQAEENITSCKWFDILHWWQTHLLPGSPKSNGSCGQALSSSVGDNRLWQTVSPSHSLSEGPALIIVSAMPPMH